MREVFTAPMILNADYDPARAATAVARGDADAITFGRPYIANPDLTHRIADGLPLAKDVAKTWYSQGPEGYIDYPVAA